MAGFPACYFCIKALSETDQTEDLKKNRCADPDPARRREPDRPDKRVRNEIFEAHQKRHAENLQGRGPWHVHDAKG